MNDYFKNDNLNEKQSKVTNHSDSYTDFRHKWSYDNYTQNVHSTPKKQKSFKGLKIFAVTVSAAFLVTLSCFLTFIVMDAQDNNNRENYRVYPTIGNNITEKVNKVYTTANSQNNVSGSTVSGYTGSELTNQEIISLAKPSVVGIVTSVKSYYGYTSQGVASGFIISEDGYIVTNYHVIEEASSVKVVLNDETEHAAEVVGYDSLADVAVLKISVDNGPLPALVIGDSEAINEGDFVIAIGTPCGIEFSGTATHGMISAVNRVLEIADSYGRVTKTMTVIQTDAAINPGNSGGPLLNNRGEVIGINTLKLSDISYQGIGFAIPINGVMDIVDQLIENGVVIERPENGYVTGKAALGISYYELSEREAKQYGVPQGVLVFQVTPNSAADKYGLKRGDIITSFDGTEIKSSSELSELLSAKKAGDTVIITVFRDDYIDVTVILGQAVS